MPLLSDRMSLSKKPVFSYHGLVWLLIGIFLCIKIQFLFVFSTWFEWDEAVYLGAGKYLFSAGTAGLFEDIRPLFLPLFLGLFWKTGLNPMIYGRLLEFAFSAGLVYMTWRLARDIYGEQGGFFAAFILVTSPLFLFYSDRLYTEIPSVFFVMLSLYVFIRGRIGLAGVLAGLAFLMKFPQGLIVPVFVLSLLLEGLPWKDSFKKILILCFSFTAAILPYFIFNFFFYRSEGLPLVQTLFLPLVHARFFESNVVYSGGTFRNFFFYVLQPLKDHGLLIFAFAQLLGLFVFRRIRSFPEKTAVLYAVIFLLYFSMIPHKSVRYWEAFFPIFAVFASGGIVFSLRFLQRKKSYARLNGIFFVLLVVFMISFYKISHIPLKGVSSHNISPAARYDYLNNLPPGAILTSHPLPCAYTDRLFIPFYLYASDGAKTFPIYEKYKTGACGFLFFPDLVLCGSNDMECEREKERFIRFLSQFKKLKEGPYETFYLLNS